MQILKVNITIGCHQEANLFDLDHMNYNSETKLTLGLVFVMFGLPPLHAIYSSILDFISLCFLWLQEQITTNYED